MKESGKVDKEARQHIAEKYVRDCLAIMDGTAEAGIARIGTARFDKTVRDVIKVLPQTRPSAGKETKQ